MIRSDMICHGSQLCPGLGHCGGDGKVGRQSGIHLGKGTISQGGPGNGDRKPQVGFFWEGDVQLGYIQWFAFLNMRIAGNSGSLARAARLSFRVEWWLIQFPPKVCAVVIVIFLYLRILQGSWAPIGTEGTSVNSAMIPWFGSNSAVRDPMNRSNCIAGFPQRNYFSNLLWRKISCTNVSGQQKRNPASPKFTISMGIETYWNHQTMGGKDGIYDIHGRSHRWRTSKRTWTRSGAQPRSSSQQDIKKRLALG